MTIQDRVTLIPRKLLEDSRGSFLKAIRGDEADLPKFTGEVYLVWAKPGASRGGHYHNIAKEWFTLLEGKCRLSLVDPESGEHLDIMLDSKQPVTAVVPARIAHCFHSLDGEPGFLLLAYSSVLYDPADTVLYPC